MTDSNGKCVALDPSEDCSKGTTQAICNGMGKLCNWQPLRPPPPPPPAGRCCAKPNGDQKKCAGLNQKTCTDRSGGHGEGPGEFCNWQTAPCKPPPGPHDCFADDTTCNPNPGVSEKGRCCGACIATQSGTGVCGPPGCYKKPTSDVDPKLTEMCEQTTCKGANPDGCKAADWCCQWQSESPPPPGPPRPPPPSPTPGPTPSPGYCCSTGSVPGMDDSACMTQVSSPGMCAPARGCKSQSTPCQGTPSPPSPPGPKNKGLSLLAKAGIAVVVGALMALLIYLIAMSAKHEKGVRKSGGKK